LVKSPYQLWKEEQERSKKNPIKVPRNVTPYNPGERRKSSTEGSYNWESDNLKYVSGHGRGYNDRFTGTMNDIGVNDPNEIEGFRNWLDFQETTADRKNKEEQDFKSIFDKINNFKPQVFSAPKVKDVPKKEELVGNLKPKHDGKERDGVLGAIDRYVVPVSHAASEWFAPGNAETMARKNSNNPVVNAAQKDRGLETKILHGIGILGATAVPAAKGYKAADFILNKSQKATKLPKLAQQALRGGMAGGATEAAISGVNEWVNPEAKDLKDHAIQTGLGIAGGAVLDPAAHGIGKLISNMQANKALNQINPDDLTQYTGKPSQEVMNNLGSRLNKSLPSKPLPPLNIENVPNVKRNPVDTLNEFLGKKSNSPLVDIAKKVNYEPRPMKDFSFGKPLVEPRESDDIISRHYGFEKPFDPIEDASPEYWQKRYTDFANYVNENYDTNRLSQEALEDIWTQFARPEEAVNLEQLVDLAYTGYKPKGELDINKAWDQFKNKETASPSAKRLLGIDNAAFNPKLQNFNKQESSNGLNDLMKTLNNVKKPGDVPNLANTLPNIKKLEQQPGQSSLQSLNEFISKLPKKQDPTPIGGLIPNFNKGGAVATKEPNLRGFVDTLQTSKKPTPDLLEALKLKDNTYSPLSNETTVGQANARIRNGIEDSMNFIQSADKFTAEHVTTGLRLIDELQKNGDVGRAVDVAEMLAKKGTEAGQTVQAFSIYNRLSPEGILIYANRIASRTNQKFNAVGDKGVKIDKEMATNLTDLASSIQAMTKQTTVANDVINLMDKARKGTQLTDTELKEIARFVNDAKQFIGDITPQGKPKLAKTIKDKVIKDKVVKFLDSQEVAARKRLEERRNRMNSLPVDVFYDYAVIGASKIAKGTINLADFSNEMIREFGDEVKPYVEQIYRKASEMVDTQAGRITKTRLSDLEKITNSALKTAKISEDEANSIREFAKNIGTMSGDMKDEANMELQAILQLLERPSLLQQISTTQTIAQLLNPKTVIRNAIGNELFYRTERINKMVATPIDWARSKVTKGARTVTFQTNNQGEYWKNWMKGAKAGWKGVSPDGLQTRYDLRPNSFRSDWNPLKYMEKALGSTLQSFDYAGYKRAVNQTIGELATLRAMNEGLTGQAKKEAIERYIREVDENVLAIADQYGKYVTFQDNNLIAVGLQKFKRGLNAGKDFGFGDLIIKYPKTPGALITRSLEYSPAGFLRSFYTIGKSIRQGEKVDIREVTESLTRAMIGTGGITGVAWFLAEKGILTGTGGTDWDIQELERLAGKMEYSVNITALQRWVTNGFDESAAEVQKGDKYVSYNWAQPVAISMSLGANAQKQSEQPGKTDYLGNAYDLASGAFDTMVDQSVLSGLKGAFNIYPGQSVMDKAVDIAGNLPSSFVPTAVNQVRQLSDNTSRNTYNPDKLNEFGNRARNRIPILEKKLPPGYDTLGNQKEVYQNESNNLFNVLLNPAFVREYKPSREAEMVLEVLNDTGDSKVAPRRAVKYFRSGGERFDLTPEQYSEYQRRLGEATRKGLNRLANRGYKDSEYLAEEIYDMLNEVGKEVREEMKIEVIPGYKKKKK
jgi:hypothetical protein